MKHLWMLWMCGVCAGAMGQSSSPLPDKAPTTQSGKEPAKDANPDPSLDELLGLPKTNQPDRSKGDSSEPLPGKPSDANKAALDRLLTTEEVEEEFEQAVQLMGEASARLGSAKDSGIETQRLQESILRKLDKLLDDAQKRQQKQQKSSSSSSKQQQQQKQQGQQPNQQKSASQKSQAQESQQATAQGGPPGRRDGAGSAVNAGGGAQWGNLPQRERDSLLQGQGDSYSTTYRTKTEEYYKRLAEEPKTSSPK